VAGRASVEGDPPPLSIGPEQRAFGGVYGELNPALVRWIEEQARKN
jgi:hypothetical protein